jgi:hypothetical protein
VEITRVPPPCLNDIAAAKTLQFFLPSRAKGLPSFREVGTVVINACLEVVYCQIDTKGGYRHKSM